MLICQSVFVITASSQGFLFTSPLLNEQSENRFLKTNSAGCLFTRSALFLDQPNPCHDARGCVSFLKTNLESCFSSPFQILQDIYYLLRKLVFCSNFQWQLLWLAVNDCDICIFWWRARVPSSCPSVLHFWLCLQLREGMVSLGRLLDLGDSLSPPQIAGSIFRHLFCLFQNIWFVSSLSPNLFSYNPKEIYKEV